MRFKQSSKYRSSIIFGKINQFEEIIKIAYKENKRALIIVNWCIVADKDPIYTVEKKINTRSIFDKAIAEANHELQPLGCPNVDEKEFVYVYSVRQKASFEVFQLITKELLNHYNPSQIKIICKDDMVKQYAQSRGLCISSFHSIGARLLVLQQYFNNFLYILTRVVVGLSRYSKTKSQEADNDCIIIGNSDIYRSTEAGRENPITGPVSREVKKKGLKIQSINFPSRPGSYYKKISDLFKDKEVIPAEIILLKYIFRKPKLFIKSLLMRLRSFRSIHSSSGEPSFTKIIVAAFREFICDHKVSHVITTGEYSRFPKSLITGANQLGIKTIGLQHGVIHSRHPGYTLGHYAERISTPDQLLLFAQIYKDVIERVQGPFAPELGLLGNPAVQSLKKTPPQYTEKLNRNLRVLIASQPQTRPLLSECCACAYKNSWLIENVDCVVKLHPAWENERRFFFDIGLPEFFNNFEVISSERDLYEELAMADLVISRNSTILQEAISIGLPVMEILDKTSEYQFGEEFGHHIPKGMISSSSPENLMVTLHEALKQIQILSEKREQVTMENIADFDQSYRSILPFLSIS